MGNTPDDNDLLRSGQLPIDPEADSVPMDDPNVREDREQSTLPETVGHHLPQSIQRMFRRAAFEETPISLPWDNINESLSGGLWPGMYVLVGNTGTGKSQWALQTALFAAQNDTPILYIGLELDELSIVARLLGLLSEQRWSYLAHGYDRSNIEKVVSRFGPELEKLPIHTEFAPPYGWNYNRLERKAKLMREKYPLKKDSEGQVIRGSRPFMIIIDYLQIVAAPPNVREDLRTRVQKTAYAARAIARELDAIVLLLSSTARENYSVLGGSESKKGQALGEGNPARLVGLGKESGEIEYGADGVFVLSREPWKDKTPPQGGTVNHLAIAKNRSGPPSWCRLRFNFDRFEEESTQDFNIKEKRDEELSI
ncbi:MAG: DnaB-like helicase C-terminal domain-containing protein [Planctomycetota bacterium]|nr:DnaB-like helicase C-terminal domain-containing protein [Planctomycetota bacterium]